MVEAQGETECKRQNETNNVHEAQVRNFESINTPVRTRDSESEVRIAREEGTD